MGHKKSTTLHWTITSVFLDELLNFLYQVKKSEYSAQELQNLQLCHVFLFCLMKP